MIVGQNGRNPITLLAGKLYEWYVDERGVTCLRPFKPVEGETLEVPA